MRRILSTSVVLMLLACAMASAETRRALVIGIDDYLSPADNLAGAVNDAEAVACLLETPRFGFAVKDVVRLRNSDATRERILAEMRRLFLQASAAGDLAVLYVASHGAQMQNTLSPEQDKTDETIVPHPKPKRADIRDKELGKILEEAARKGVRVTAILDSCHSGSMERGLSRQERMRALAPDPGAVAADKYVPDPVAAGALMLAAAQDFQTAAEALDASGTPHGAFTIALLQRWGSPVTAAAVPLRVRHTNAMAPSSLPCPLAQRACGTRSLGAPGCEGASPSPSGTSAAPWSSCRAERRSAWRRARSSRDARCKASARWALRPRPST
jgi:hypothetical protein